MVKISWENGKPKYFLWIHLRQTEDVVGNGSFCEPGFTLVASEDKNEISLARCDWIVMVKSG